MDCEYSGDFYGYVYKDNCFEGLFILMNVFNNYFVSAYYDFIYLVNCDFY